MSKKTIKIKSIEGEGEGERETRYTLSPNFPGSVIPDIENPWFNHSRYLHTTINIICDL
jgi:hypothetical protein